MARYTRHNDNSIILLVYLEKLNEEGLRYISWLCNSRHVQASVCGTLDVVVNRFLVLMPFRLCNRFDYSNEES